MASVPETKRFESSTTEHSVEYQNGPRGHLDGFSEFGEDLPHVPEEVSLKTINKTLKLDWKLRAVATLGGITAIASGVFPALNADNGRDSKDSNDSQRNPIARSIDSLRLNVAEAA